MAKREQDPLVEMLVDWLKIGWYYFVVPYAVVGVFIAYGVGAVYPKALAVVIAILVVIGIAGSMLYVYARQKAVHYLMARRADRQNAAYLKGDESGVHGKFQPERLD